MSSTILSFSASLNHHSASLKSSRIRAKIPDAGLSPTILRGVLRLMLSKMTRTKALAPSAQHLLAQ